jgi:hypothetical protein
LVITASNPRLFRKSGLIDCFTGWTTGIKAGVSIMPLGVASFPIRPARSEYLISKDNFYSYDNIVASICKQTTVGRVEKISRQLNQYLI